MPLGSPGLEIIESTYTDVLVDGSLPIAVYAGNFSKGPMETFKPIDSVESFVEIFGLPNNINYNDWYQVYNYLQYDNGAIYVNRIGGTDVKPDSLSYTFMIPKPDDRLWSIRVNQQDYKLDAYDIVDRFNTMYPHSIVEFEVHDVGTYLLFINKSKTLELNIEIYTEDNDFTQNQYFCGVDYNEQSISFKLAKNTTALRWITALWLKPNEQISASGKYSLGVEVNGIEVDQRIFDDVYGAYPNGFDSSLTYHEAFEMLIERIGLVKNKDYYYDGDTIKAYHPNTPNTKQSYKTVRFFPKQVYQRHDIYHKLFWNKNSTQFVTRVIKV